MIKEYIFAIVNGQDLSRDQAHQAMLLVISGRVDPAQIAGFLTALKAKGETVDELAGFVQAMRDRMVAINPAGISIDLCGTGGDRKNTFNISTTASFVVSAAGLSVAKHGNRSVSSSCGSADILEKLGVKINLTPEAAEKCLSEIGYTFLFAPNFHPAMKNVAPVRKALGIPTVFNILGPLCNPAQVRRQLIGVYDSARCQLVASTLNELSAETALVVHSQDGLDEISPAGPTNGMLLLNGSVSRMEINPQAMGITAGAINGLSVKDADESVRLVHSVLNGDKSVARDAVLLNAGAALYIGGRSKSIAEGVALAGETIDSGKARKKLEEFISTSNKL
ncbi:MAG: anthranilate phosphoribosyltransferase [Planctomycetes bacterium]|nr:anthranilate phosphoribosyltransferase [Planctomycetota bacterium]